MPCALEKGVAELNSLQDAAASKAKATEMLEGL